MIPIGKQWLWGALAIAALLFVGSAYKIPSLESMASDQWQQVATAYKERAALAPELVEAINAHAKHERAAMDAVTQAASDALQITLDDAQRNDPEQMKQFEMTQARLSKALSRLATIGQNYPPVKSSKAFQLSQSRLGRAEEQIATARQSYIDTIVEHNTAVITFPGVFWAALYGADQKPNFSGLTATGTTSAGSF